jgi:hypothetical protein
VRTASFSTLHLSRPSFMGARCALWTQGCGDAPDPAIVCVNGRDRGNFLEKYAFFYQFAFSAHHKLLKEYSLAGGLQRVPNASGIGHYL